MLIRLRVLGKPCVGSLTHTRVSLVDVSQELSEVRAELATQAKVSQRFVIERGLDAYIGVNVIRNDGDFTIVQERNGVRMHLLTQVGREVTI